MKENKGNKGNKGNKLVVDDIKVIVRGIENKPYYEIKYREVGNNDYNIGFGSYDLNNVLKWKEEEFEVVSEKAEKETKEVTNEELLEHLKDIEIAHSCTLNGILTLFEIISARQDRLELSYVERISVDSGALAISGVIQRLHDISGLTELAEEVKKEERKEPWKELSNTLGEFMKEFKEFLK